MIDACDPCLRRAFLIAHLAPRIAGLLGRGERRATGLLALPEHDLIAAAAGRRVEQALAFLQALDVDAERERLATGANSAVCPHADAYPPLLRDLADPPAVLFLTGRPDVLDLLRDEPSVTIVGTRRASPYGTEVAYALGRGLGAAGVPVVSGLALGIDGTAHRGCLDGGGVPVAVVASGPDVVYPRRHRSLHERVCREGGVLSELPPGTEPFRWSFPARNRIMAGLARMTLVVEAADPSGSLITAEFAKDLGRCVAAVPGRVTSTVARGTNNLLRDGATPISGTEDVLDELFGVGARTVADPGAPPSGPGDPALRSVLAAADAHDSVEAIADAAGMTIAHTRAALGRLELDGHLVRRDLGGWERVAR
ncbi:MAG TPA: DNA-processing protein DprA [Thermoleophilaceae bacterium]|nr:DNA-processing protein DprA [Thermoleophilaceae bacterium]